MVVDVSHGVEPALDSFANCRLCGKLSRLQLSHAIPAFVINWMKDTSATGYLRFGQVPNQRRQDGYKAYWLCGECETILNQCETPFARHVFHPLNDNSGLRVAYEEWMLRFCVSVSWRALLTLEALDGLSEYTDHQLASIAGASDTWREFLLGRKPHPAQFEQHFLPFDAVTEAPPGSLPPNFNRYILRSIAMDIVRGRGTMFTLSKLGRFFILGFIELRNPGQWHGTKIRVRGGFLGGRDYAIPREFMQYVVDKAYDYARVNARISQTQRNKIHSTMMSNLNRSVRSSSLEAMSYDVNLFGRSAFEIHKPDTTTKSE